MFDLYPYTNFHELNQDWILGILKKFENELKQAIDYKTIHYADPLQWNITTQYAPNTVVVDENTGIAYISKDAVPSGILLSDENYWMVIFDYQKIYNKIMSGVAFNEKDNETASKDLLVNDLVWYHGDLYRVTRAISTGSRYIIGTNLVATTIESLLSTYYGRDRVAQLLNDTVNVSGDYTINAGDIAETGNNVTIHSKQDMLLDADGNLTAQVTGDKTSEVSGNTTINCDGGVRGNIKGDVDITAGNTVYNSNSIVFNTLKKQINLDTIPQTCVNVKDFGAVGDASFYDKVTRKFYKDSDFKTRPTNDTTAVNAAITYAITKGIKTVYFPDGDYFLPNWSYKLDSSVLRFWGSSHTSLCVEDLTSNTAVISIVSSFTLKEYDYARVPLKNITISGNFNTGADNKDTYSGIEYSLNAGEDSLVSPHISLENVTIKNFNVGIKTGTCYKSVLYNINIIACNYGIYLKQTSTAVPLTIIAPHIECCVVAIYSLAPRYNIINIYGGSIEYCRVNVASDTDFTFFGTRFEGDLLSCLNMPDKTPANLFNLTNGCLTLNNCQILLLPNYADNVRYWLNDTSVASEFKGNLFYCSSPQEPCLVLNNVFIATDQWTATNVYAITGGKFFINNCYLAGSIKNSKTLYNPANLIPNTAFYGSANQ